MPCGHNPVSVAFSLVALNSDYVNDDDDGDRALMFESNIEWFNNVNIDGNFDFANCVMNIG